MKRHIWIAIIVTTIGLISIFALMRERHDIESKLKETAKLEQSRTDVELEGAVFKEVVKGVTYWELRSEHSVFDEPRGAARLEVTRGTFFEKGRPTLRFVSPHAVWKRRAGTIQLIDVLGYTLSVQKAAVQSKKNHTAQFYLSPLGADQAGAWFNAEKLLWSVAHQKLECEGKVELRRGDLTIRSEHLLSDVGLMDVELFGNPVAHIREATLTANRFRVHRRDNSMDADGPAHVSYQKSETEAGKIRYEEKTQKIILSPMIQFTLGDITATSESATYDLKEDRVRLEGKPSVRRGSSHIRGKVIMISLRDKRVTVLGKGAATIQEGVIP